MVRPTAERLLSRLWRCCSIGLIATAALAQLILLDPGEPATAALLPAEAMEECRAGRATFAVLSLTHNYKVIAREVPRAEMQACMGDRGHDLDAIPEPTSAVYGIELCISSSEDALEVVRIVMMNFQ